jgi:hypothetical protein
MQASSIILSKLNSNVSRPQRRRGRGEKLFDRIYRINRRSEEQEFPLRASCFVFLFNPVNPVKPV